MLHLQHLIPPPKIRPLRARFGRKASPAILEVGIANHAAGLAKHWFPNCRFHGADISDADLDAGDRAALDHFHPVGPDGIAGYESIPDEFFDAVILNHVLEHLHQPDNLVRTAIRKVRPGGVIYAAFPSRKSLGLPSAEGTLQFCDDPGHVTMIDLGQVANLMLHANVRVIFAGRTRDPIRFLVGALILPLALVQRLITGRMRARGLWYVLGFEDSIVGIKRSAPGL